MLERIALRGAATFVSIFVLACGQPPGDGGGAAGDALEAAAEIDGVAVTIAELDQFIKDELFAQRATSPAKLYELREQLLEALVQQRALEMEAAKQGVSPEALLEAEMDSLGPVTDAEVTQWYEENRSRLGGVGFDDVSDRIREFLSSQRAEQAAQGLLARAEVTTFLEAPRLDIVADGPSRGPADALITIVEFSDFQCPFCRRVLPTLEQVFEKYPNDVRLVYRHLPLRSHGRARPAAEAALCAQDQAQFWEYHDALFANTQALEDADLVGYAEEIGLDKSQFEQCLGESTFAAKVDDDVEAAQSAGITGTPAFIVNGILISGARSPEEFYRVIDKELARLATPSS